MFTSSNKFILDNVSLPHNDPQSILLGNNKDPNTIRLWACIKMGSQRQCIVLCSSSLSNIHN